MMFVNQNGPIAVNQLGIYNMIIKKLSNKTGLTEEMIYKMMGINHLYKFHYKKKDLKKVEFETETNKDKRTMKKISLIAKTLKITTEAVIVALIMSEIQNKNSNEV